jgi:hypothetical protein
MVIQYSEWHYPEYYFAYRKFLIIFAAYSEESNEQVEGKLPWEAQSDFGRIKMRE